MHITHVHMQQPITTGTMTSNVIKKVISNKTYMGNKRDDICER